MTICNECDYPFTSSNCPNPACFPGLAKARREYALKLAAWGRRKAAFYERVGFGFFPESKPTH